MNAGWFLTYHEIPELLQNWLAGLGVRDPERGARDLADLTRRAGPDGSTGSPGSPSSSTRSCRGCPDPGMALTNLERFLAAVPRIDETLDQLVGDAADDRDPAPGLQHQPVLQRGPDPRPRAVRLAPGAARSVATDRP